MVAIRAAHQGDAGAIAAIYAPHVLTGSASFETAAPDAAAMAARMQGGGGLYPWLVAVDDGGAVLGYAYATRFGERDGYRWSVETSVYLADAAQRRGIGRRLYGALLATLRAQGFVQAVGRIALPNAASIALHKAVGFKPAGVLRAIGWKHGCWLDVGLWQRTLAIPAEPPAAPLRFDAVGLREA